jgi:hypothetical protein
MKNDPDTPQSRQNNLKECYTEKARITLDENFCDKHKSYSDDLELKYSECYILLDPPVYRDRTYCENKYPVDTESKYRCAYCVIQYEDKLKDQDPDVMDSITACITNS